MVRLQDLLNPSVEALDHAVGLRMRGRGKAVFDAEVCTEPVELVLACRGALAQTEQAVGEFLAIIGQNGADADRAGPLQIAKKPAGVGGGPGFEDADEHPAGCPIKATNR